MTPAEFFCAVYDMVDLQGKWRDIYATAQQEQRIYTDDERKVLSAMQTISNLVKEELQRTLPDGKPIIDIAKSKCAYQELKNKLGLEPM